MNVKRECGEGEVEKEVVSRKWDVIERVAGRGRRMGVYFSV